MYLASIMLPRFGAGDGVHLFMECVVCAVCLFACIVAFSLLLLRGWVWQTALAIMVTVPLGLLPLLVEIPPVIPDIPTPTPMPVPADTFSRAAASMFVGQADAADTVGSLASAFAKSVAIDGASAAPVIADTNKLRQRWNTFESDFYMDQTPTPLKRDHPTFGRDVVVPEMIRLGILTSGDPAAPAQPMDAARRANVVSLYQRLATALKGAEACEY